jgi:pilus assembly protein Flp/PilA
VKRFAEDIGGATAIEYALITTIITIGILASMQLIGTTLNTFFESITFG